MTRRIPNCLEIAINSFHLIPSYYYQDKLDSTRLILDYWNQRCEREIIDRSRIVLALKSGDFSEDSLPNYFVYTLARHDSTESLSAKPIEDEYLSAYHKYEAFLASVAADAIVKTKPGTVEHLLARHFSGNIDSTLIDLQSIDYQGTRLRRDYDFAVESIRNNYSEFYYGVGFGSWLPVSKDLNVFGARPELSLTLMSGHLGYNSQLYFAVRFGPSRSPYTFGYKGAVYTTSKFTGFSMGYEVLPRVAISPYQDFSLIAGLMIDGYSPPEGFNDADDKGANSVNATFGLKYGQRFSAWGIPVLVFEARFNPMLFSSSGLDAPVGSSATLRVSVFLGTDKRAEMLERFSYRE